MESIVQIHTVAPRLVDSGQHALYSQHDAVPIPGVN